MKHRMEEMWETMKDVSAFLEMKEWMVTDSTEGTVEKHANVQRGPMG